MLSIIVASRRVNTHSPIKQWGEVQAAVGAAYKQIVNAVDMYFKNTFHTLPAAHDSGQPGGNYIDNPSSLVQQLKNGAFAQDVTVGENNKAVDGALAASAITALWIMDKVLIIKITDRAYGQGPGKACKAFPEHSMFEVKDWFVFGIGPTGKGGDGTQNGEHLADFGLDKRIIALASEKTQKQQGFHYDNQNGATIELLTTNPTKLKSEDMCVEFIPLFSFFLVLEEPANPSSPL